jgi:sec-independent protein translocase protein TatA
VDIGPPEIILIILVIVLLFGAKKLPELARGTGRALRIFKAETKGLHDDDDTVDPDRPVAKPAIEPPPPSALEAHQVSEPEQQRTDTDR